MLERISVTVEEAIEMLPDGDDVYTFRNPAGCMLIGADWYKEHLIAAMRANEKSLELSGEQAQSMNHGLVFMDESGYLFVETKKGEAEC